MRVFNTSNNCNCICLGMSARGGVPGGVSAQGVYPAEPEADTPSPVNRMTDRCKNITFQQLLLRTVKIFVTTVKGSNLPPSRLLCKRQDL